MPDDLTPQEREAIDRFPADRIQRVPRGASAFAFQWDDRTRQIRYADQRQAKAAMSANWARLRKANERRQAIKRLHGQGKTVSEIMLALDMQDAGVRYHLQILGLKPNRKAAGRPGTVKEAVRRTHKPGMAPREVLAQLTADGVHTTLATVRRTMRHLGLGRGQ